MSRRALVKLLGTGGQDPGCEGAFALLDEAVEADIQGRDVEALFPGVVEHLRSCPACGEDYLGLLTIAREDPGQGLRARS